MAGIDYKAKQMVEILLTWKTDTTELVMVKSSDVVGCLWNADDDPAMTD